MPKCSVDTKSMVAAEDAVRDIKNWIAVFSTEQELSDDARKQLEAKLDELVKKISQVKCK